MMRYSLLLLFSCTGILHAEQLDEQLLALNSLDSINTIAVDESPLKTARLLIDQERFKDALPYFEEALKTNATDTQTIFEYANTLNTVNQTHKALTLYQQLLKTRSNDSSILYNTAYTLKKLGRIQEAMPFYQAALQKKPDHAEAHFSLGLAHLMNGNFKEGWPEYEWRWQRNCQLKPRTFKQPQWDGSPLGGKIIFLHAEQGLGDTFQFIRYAKVIKEKYKGTIIVAAVQRPLMDIITHCCPYIDKVITLDQMPAQFDFHAPLMSLPLILGTEEKTIPTPIPYITPDPALVDHWQRELASDTNIKVGICWQGNNQYSTPFLRAVVAAKSVALATFAPLTHIPGISFYSLQKETGTEQIATINQILNIKLFDDHFDKDHGRFMDTAAVMKNLDLIITIDTSIAHLAGAMGIPTWVLLPEPPDWRWMLHRSDSPWYPDTMHLIRQSKVDDWDTVIQTIATALQEYATTKRRPSSPLIKKSTEKNPIIAGDTITSFETTLHNNPDDARTHYEYGMYLANLDQKTHYQKASYHLKKAIELKPLQIDWLFGYGTFCCRIGKFRDALNAYRMILDQNSSMIPVLYNSGYTFKLAGELDMAIAIYKRILARQPDYEPAHLALAFALLSSGDFAEGWREHRWNLAHQNKNGDTLRMFLKNNTIAGKTIVLTPEGGLGDTIHFVRYAERLHQMGARVIVVAQQPLITLLSGSQFIDQLIPLHTPCPSGDATASLMSLPAIFEDLESSLPRNIPYIFPPQERIAYWQQQLQHDANLKIGICWQPDLHNDVSRLPIARRGIPLAQFFKLGALPGITLYSLQQKEGLDQLENLPRSMNFRVFDASFDQKYGNFIDSAAVMQSLDLIITTDTAIAHLAGAMGKRVWLLLPYATDWRWIHDRSDSPWYPTMRIFKQPEPFDWESVMQEVIDAFKKEIQKQ